MYSDSLSVSHFISLWIFSIPTAGRFFSYQTRTLWQARRAIRGQLRPARMTSTLLADVLDVGGIVGVSMSWEFTMDTFSIDNIGSFGRKPKAGRKARLQPGRAATLAGL